MEIIEKLQKIKEITGSKSMLLPVLFAWSLYLAVGLDNIDLEGDFDPDKYDQDMSAAFDKGYYEEKEVFTMFIHVFLNACSLPRTSLYLRMILMCLI